MGLFDMFKNIKKDDLIKMGKDVVSGIQNAASDAILYNDNKNDNGVSTLREEYAEFPTFDKKPDKISYKKEQKYTRCTMDFYSTSQQEVENYIFQIESQGYSKGPKVRYDKENTYIIVDYDGFSSLNLVFHIKR